MWELMLRPKDALSCGTFIQNVLLNVDLLNLPRSEADCVMTELLDQSAANADTSEVNWWSRSVKAPMLRHSAVVQANDA